MVALPLDYMVKGLTVWKTLQENEHELKHLIAPFLPNG